MSERAAETAAPPRSPDPVLPPPTRVQGPVAWMRENLFSSWSSGVLTIVGLWLIYQIVSWVIDWAIVSAVWTGDDGTACSAEGTGACWPFITNKLGLFLYGRYPFEERWRVDLTYVLALAGLVPLMIPRVVCTPYTTSRCRSVSPRSTGRKLRPSSPEASSPPAASMQVGVTST